VAMPGAGLAVYGLMQKDSGTKAILNIIGLIAVGIGGWFMQKGRAAGRLYELTDKYRDSLIDKRLRSLMDLSTLTDASPDEIVDELKELQEVGLFRQFSVDRKNMQLIENASWGDTGSSKLTHVAFPCSSCGASNSIYTVATAKSGVCEYCGSTVAL